MATTAAPRSARLGRLERPALTGVLVREVVHYSSYWKSSTFSSTVEPTIYLLAFGFGFGSLVSRIGGYDYVDFVGTGTVATAVLFSSAFPPCSGRSSSTSSSARATRSSRRPATRPRRKA
jgi:lipooligosaccharide transport system permease protein